MTKKKAVILGVVFGICCYIATNYLLYYELTYGVSIIDIWKYSKLHFAITLLSFSVGASVLDYFRRANKGKITKSKRNTRS